MLLLRLPQFHGSPTSAIPSGPPSRWATTAAPSSPSFFPAPCTPATSSSSLPSSLPTSLPPLPPPPTPHTQPALSLLPPAPPAPPRSLPTRSGTPSPSPAGPDAPEIPGFRSPAISPGPPSDTAAL